MSSKVLSRASETLLSYSPPATSGPGFRVISVASYSSSSSSDSNAESVEIPENLNSLQFLQFAGFSEDAASVIWRSWSSAGVERHWVVDEAKHYVREMGKVRDACSASDDWNGAFRAMGMSQEFCDRVMNPAFDLVRLTECACYWALDTIDEAFHYLSVLDQRIQQTQLAARGPAPLANIADDMAPPQQAENRTMFFKGGTQSRPAFEGQATKDCTDT
ncbi:hypothetical protein G6O67_004207 [Ophiocordyceps sinensis]|uniref:Uncharacterized protein n=2 Tax=Ophiocordyceps sinensis TaxID=72228 RepID=A0A8H4M075_9HYPO|nr:hypothetical protein OCS_00874 [Ophiocordyceps sinensis CO18]KAF4507741.1 hypothetical protein G6O67_004207 [Ophiocordyceps sinensis]